MSIPIDLTDPSVLAPLLLAAGAVTVWFLID
jgi:hypothetical protein